MGIVAVWLMLVMYIAWKGGISQGLMPAPYRFWGASGSMAFAALIGLLNDRVGTLVAVGLALGAVFYYQGQPPKIDTADALLFGVPASASDGTARTGKAAAPGHGPAGAPPGVHVIGTGGVNV